ncbi:MAG: acyl--CoA ligase [Candidatus Sericytochromatia bacterium]|nr:acyl--CoA ligase [Candidatus Tanganyikabacteria bacterium]
MLLHHDFEKVSSQHPDRTALACGPSRITYGELAESADRLAAFMVARGVGRGDRVALLLPNCVEMVVGLLAAQKAGAVFMPIGPSTKAAKIRYLLGDAEPACLIAHGSLAGEWREAADGCASLSAVIEVGTRSGARAIPWVEARADGHVASPCIDQDLAAIIYTSGSTGEPKGVMLTHLNMLSARRSISTYLGLEAHDVILCALPLSFDYGLYQVLMALALGATVVLEASFAYPVALLDTMAEHRVTVFPGVPTLFAMLLSQSDLSRYDMGALRIVTNTAAALPEARIREIRDRFPQARLFSMYGLTECKRVTYLPPEELDRRPTSVGRGMPNEEVYLVDEAGNRLPPGSTGELVIRGSNVMRGYWRKPAETAERLKAGAIPGELVLHSGDVFRTDAEGFLYFVGRKDDIIKSRGEKVSPREVEDVLCKHPGILDAAVLGMPDPVLGQAVAAFVVLRPGSAPPTDRDVLKHCAAHLETFMVPRQVIIVASLPRTPNGKVDKASLAERGAAPATVTP